MERCPLCTAILPDEAERCNACGKKLGKPKAQKRSFGRFGKKPGEGEEAFEEVEPTEEESGQPFDHAALFADESGPEESGLEIEDDAPPPPVAPPPVPEPEAFDHTALFADPTNTLTAPPPPPEPPAAESTPAADTFAAEAEAFAADSFSTDFSSGSISGDSLPVDSADALSVDAFAADSFSTDFSSVSEAVSSAEPVEPETFLAQPYEVEPIDSAALFADAEPASSPEPAASPEDLAPPVLAAHDDPPPPPPAPPATGDGIGDDDLFAAFAEVFLPDD